MQRQSLGSPVSKLQIHGGKDQNLEKEENRNDAEEEDDKKSEKHLRSYSRAQKSIHLIPILTIFCLLVLYLASHDPSQNDATDVGDLKQFLDLEKGENLAIRSHRILQEAGKFSWTSRPSNRHRKFGNF